MPTPLLRLENLTCSYPGVLALDDVTFELQAGEVHALVGENGAGKSTLIKVVAGVRAPDAGRLVLNGQPIRLANAIDARRRGIATVHQEAELFPALSVAENIALSQGLPKTKLGQVDWKRIRRTASQVVDEIEEPIDPDMPAALLSVGRRHMIQVAAALLLRAKVVVLDEPTSALGDHETHWLYRQIERLKESGTGIIYISHRQDEIFRLADRITVLRDGRYIWTRPKDEVDRGDLIQAMVGRETAQTAPRPLATAAPAVPRLQVERLSDRHGRVKDINLTAYAGEIVALYGLVGAGRSEFARAIFGLDKPLRAAVAVDGKPVTIHSPQHALAAGIAYVPADRLHQGLCRGLSVRANLVLSSLRQWSTYGLTNRSAERRAAGAVAERLGLRCRSLEQPAGELSGGNQQKVVLGRWLLSQPKVLILDEPTRGIDVAAKSEIHRDLRQLADSGCAIVMISSDLPEVTDHADRVVVFREGRVVGEFGPGESAQRIAAAALPADAPSGTPTAGVQSRRTWQHARGLHSLMVIDVVLCAWLMVTSAGFSPLSVLESGSVWVVLALAAACVIIAGGIDISIGSLMALAAVTAALVLKIPWPSTCTIPLAIVAAAGVGLAGGLINAAVALVGRVHPIVVTLGAMTVYRGLVIVLMGGKPMTGLPPEFGRLAIDPVSGFMGMIVAAGAITAAVYYWLAHRPSGRYLYAVGCGPTAATLAGISLARVWLTAFGVGGLLAGLAGVMQLAMNQQMQATLGQGWELSAIAIAVLGGVAINGGRGHVLGVVLAALLLRLVSSALVHWSISGERVDLFVGTMILAAVLVDLFWRRRAP